MKPLPATRYEFAEWKTAIVNIDCHVDAEQESSGDVARDDERVVDGSLPR